MGTWTPLRFIIPNANLDTMLLLTDGTVMVKDALRGASVGWHKLTPDSTGSYVNGTWSTLANMNLGRLYFDTTILRDGRLFVCGGEYSGSPSTANDANKAEIYDPVTDTWTPIADFPESICGDAPSMLLPDNRIIVAYIIGSQTFIYDPVSNTWAPGGDKLRGTPSDEETWVKLADDSILTYEINSQPHAQRYVPASNTWVDAGTVPVLLSDPINQELGPALLLPDGRVMYFGCTGHTAFYHPFLNSWTAGPDIPDGRVTDDAPGCMMPNGNILFAADTLPYTSPTHVYEFNPITNIYTDVTPTDGSLLDFSLSVSASYTARMLMLPTGEVLFSCNFSQGYVYTPDGSPLTAWQPTINNIVSNVDDSYTLYGTQLNGLSCGASYGDDAQMDTNYPIIKLVGLGSVYFAKTFNWHIGVATGSVLVSTDFSIPAIVPGGVYSLYVIANGIASDPVSFTYVVPIISLGIGTANGNSTASGIGIRKFTALSIGTAHGDSIANAVGIRRLTVLSVGTAHGDSTANGIGVTIFSALSIGTANGDSTANAFSMTVETSIGTANGDSIADAFSITLGASIGTANGDSTADAIGIVFYAFVATDLAFVLSGGSQNTDPNKSLGGAISSRPLIGTLNNLFSDVSGDQLKNGLIDYRCFYMTNNSRDNKLSNVNILISETTCCEISIGTTFVNDIQQIQLNEANGGSIQFGFNDNLFTVDWNSDSSVLAQSIETGLLTTGLSDIIVNSLGTNAFNVNFFGRDGNRNQPLITIAQNNIIPIGTNCQVIKINVGAPINSTAIQIPVSTLTPHGVEFFDAGAEINLPSIFPADSLPIWIKRVVAPATLSKLNVGFTFNLQGVIDTFQPG